MNRNVKKTANVYLNANQINYRNNAIQMNNHNVNFMTLGKIREEYDDWTAFDNAYA